MEPSSAYGFSLNDLHYNPSIKEPFVEIGGTLFLERKEAAYMIELITEGMKGNVVALTTHGKVSHEDREQVLIPAIEEKIKKFAKIRLFYHTGNDFTGYGAKAIWDDAKIAVQHSTAFERVAVVTDIFWVKETVGFFGHLMRCAVRKKGTGIFLSTRKSLRGLPDMSFVEISTCLWQVARKRLSSGRFPLNPQTS